MSEVLGDLAQLRWQDAVDVALLTLVLYRLYKWLRGTVATQVALGMLTVVAASYGASSLGLVLTAYVLQAVGAVSILVGVVIFREEIRRALTKASPLRLLLRRRAVPERRDFTAVAEALFALTRRHLGALVVLARRDPLTEYLTGGVRMDSRVSEPLLEALFQKTSPLHDGAVVIDGERITLAGAFLPLARSELPVRYGTRHSAAVGLSEVCDALVVAVSEERAEVSLAEAGLLSLIPDASTLGRRLAELAGPTVATAAPASRPVRARIKDAVVAAVIFVGVVAAWNVVANRADTLEERMVAVELHNVPSGLRLEPVPGEVTLRLRGPRRLLIRVGAANLDAWCDAAAVTRGATELAVSGTAPPGIQVVGVQPARIGLLEVRRVRVEPELAVKTARAGRVTPAEVTLVGKVGAFKGVSAVKTRPIAEAAGTVKASLALPGTLQLQDPAEGEIEVELR